MAAGILLSGVQNLAVDIAREKSDDWLRRPGGTPISPVSYFMGEIGQVLVTSVGQLILFFAFAVVVVGVGLPTDPAL